MTILGTLLKIDLREIWQNEAPDEALIPEAPTSWVQSYSAYDLVRNGDE